MSINSYWPVSYVPPRPEDFMNNGCGNTGGFPGGSAGFNPAQDLLSGFSPPGVMDITSPNVGFGVGNQELPPCLGLHGCEHRCCMAVHHGYPGSVRDCMRNLCPEPDQTLPDQEPESCSLLNPGNWDTVAGNIGDASAGLANIALYLSTIGQGGTPLISPQIETFGPTYGGGGFIPIPAFPGGGIAFEGQLSLMFDRNLDCELFFTPTVGVGAGTDPFLAFMGVASSTATLDRLPGPTVGLAFDFGQAPFGTAAGISVGTNCEAVATGSGGAAGVGGGFTIVGTGGYTFPLATCREIFQILQDLSGFHFEQ